MLNLITKASKNNYIVFYIKLLSIYTRAYYKRINVKFNSIILFKYIDLYLYNVSCLN